MCDCWRVEVPAMVSKFYGNSLSSAVITLSGRARPNVWFLLELAEPCKEVNCVRLFEPLFTCVMFLLLLVSWLD